MIGMFDIFPAQREVECNTIFCREDARLLDDRNRCRNVGAV